MKWHVIHTRPRWEKKVHNSLAEKGIESYCPLNKVHRQWSDRIKVIQEPLFKSYVFVKIHDNDRSCVRMTAGVLNFVHLNGKPSVIKEKQLQTIRRFLNNHENIEVVKIAIQEPLLEKSANLTNSVNGKQCEVKTLHFKNLGYLLNAYIDKRDLIVATTNNL